MDHDELLRAEAKTIFSILAKETISSMQFHKLSAGPDAEPETDIPCGMSKPSTIPPARFLRPEVFVDIFDSLSELQLDDDLRHLSGKFARYRTHGEAPNYNTLYIPLLRDLAKLLDKRDLLLSFGFPYMFWQLLNEYIWKFPGGQPKRDNWIRPRAPCVCDDCENLNKFLQDPLAEIGHFKMGSERRAHVAEELTRIGSDCEMAIMTATRPSHTFVVTKKFTDQEASIALWERNRAVAAENLASFDQKLLKTLLGPTYDYITTMSELPTFKGSCVESLPEYAERRRYGFPGASYKGGAVSLYTGNGAYDDIFSDVHASVCSRERRATLDSLLPPAGFPHPPAAGTPPRGGIFKAPVVPAPTPR